MQQPSHMPQPVANPIAMEQMRREFEKMSTRTPSQQNGAPQNWAGEFDPGMDQAGMAAFASQRGFDPREFERYVQSKTGAGMDSHIASPNTTMMNGYQRPMGMGYGGSMYGGGMMGMGSSMMQQPYNSMQQQQPDVKGKGKMIELNDKDWEEQFAQLEQDKTREGDLDEEATRAMEAELEDIDRSVQSPKDLFGTFEETWSKIEADMAAAKNRGMFDTGLDEDRWRNHGEFGDEWENFDSHGLNTHLKDPQLGSYMFEEENMFEKVSDPFGEGVRIMDEGGNLSLAALAFEAAVQKDSSHVEAWTRLGAAQAQNEKETPAIRALEQALKLDPGNLDALMGLAVSYTNEGYDSTAYRTLERWLSIKYPAIVPESKDPLNNLDDPFGADITFTDREALHKRVTDHFMEAARLSPTEEAMDPDVQVGLGVLFYGAEEYDKAVDCFQSALNSSEHGHTNSNEANQRPLLWNRLGATLANSGRSEEAIDAYERALELNPNFVRARYNLGVSCINIGCYEQAAQHLLGALAMHAVVEKEGREKAEEIMGGAGPGVRENDFDRLIKQNQSTNLYDTLRRVFGQMNRRDLADKVVNGVDVDMFRGEFEF